MIKNRIKQLIEVDWQNLKAIQPEDVKIQNNLDALKASLIKHGFSLPFAVWIDGADIYTIDGHTRKKALQELQAEGVEIPDKLKAVEIEAKNRKEAVEILVEVFNQKHNPFDNEVLINWLDVEQVEIQDLEAVNLSSPIIEKSETQEDDFEIPDEIKTDIKLGDLIEIGKHRLLCGDATKPEDYEKLLSDKKFDLVVTDPPYNVDYKGKTKEELKILNDTKTDEEFFVFLLNFYSSLFEFTHKGSAWYIWHPDLEGYNFRRAMKEAGVKVRQCLIWVKSTMTLGRQDYQSMHEPCLYGWKEGAPHKWFSDRKQKTVLNFDKPMRNADHPTMKPVDLIGYLIVNSSKKENIIGDPFLGSGSTMVACEQLNRICYGMELDPKYCQVIIDRMLNSYPDIEVKINGHKYQQLQTV